MKKILLLALVVGIPLFLTGCASVTGSSTQSVSVQARENAGIEVVGASCELSNNKGKWFVTTPGSVSINSSNDDLQVLCKKEQLGNGRASVVSDTKGSMFGNILFGGGIGAIVDHKTGAAYEYPTVIEIMMGGFTKISSKSKDVQPDSQISKSAVKSSSQATQVAAAKTDEEKPAVQ